MSSEGDLARVRTFFRKANELEEKGHLVRAAENYTRAAEAARALGPDNLVVVEMQRSHASVLLTYAANVVSSEAAVDPGILAAQRADCVALLSAVVAALERRRVAGTLLEGKCTAAEEAWSVEHWKAAGASAVKAASVAKLFGYELCLQTATNVICVLQNAAFFANECSAAQFQFLFQHAINAAELMLLPRSHGKTAFGEEVLFAKTLSEAAASLDAQGLDARLVQQLADAWQRLQRSGVLEARGAHDGGVFSQRLRLVQKACIDKSDGAVRAAMVAPGLRSCALAGCGAKEVHPQHFKRCSACKLVVYCSKEHQLEAWPAHKAACKAARKAADASSDGGGAGGSTA